MTKVWSYLRHRPLQRRMTVLTVLLVTLAIIVSNVAGYVALRLTLVHASQSIAEHIAADLLEPAARPLDRSDRLPAEMKQAGGVVVEVVDGRGRVARVPGADAELVLEPGDLAATGADGAVVRRTGADSLGQRYVVVVVPVPGTGKGLVVARPMAALLQTLFTARVVAALVVLLSVLGASAAGGVVARSALRPVRELATAVRRAADTRDFQPVALDGVHGELAVLSASFNHMLRSIATMRERQARLVADAGQELREPLERLTRSIEVLAHDLDHRSLTDGQRAELLADARVGLCRLTTLVRDLVHLTRDGGSETFAPLDLRWVVRNAVEVVRQRAPHHSFDVRLEEFHVVGDAEALQLAVTNLLDNAVTYSPAGSTVRVSIEGNRLRVADSGPGIPEAELPHVFDRFFRGRAARRTPGTGLGLSVVAKTVEDHGGTVHAGRSSDGGAELVVRLPGVTHAEALPDLLVRGRPHPPAPHRPSLPTVGG